MSYKAITLETLNGIADQAENKSTKRSEEVRGRSFCNISPMCNEPSTLSSLYSTAMHTHLAHQVCPFSDTL
jgi:hypothetical protein